MHNVKSMKTTEHNHHFREMPGSGSDCKYKKSGLGLNIKCCFGSPTTLLATWSMKIPYHNCNLVTTTTVSGFQAAACWRLKTNFSCFKLYE